MSKQKRPERGLTSKRVPAQVEMLEPRRLLAAVLVKDINSIPNGIAVNDTAEMGGQFYAGTDHGLIRSDGTPEAAEIVTSLVPYSMTALDDSTLLFRTSTQLWKTDGTAAGTSLVSELAPTGSANTNLWMLRVNGSVVFIAEDNTVWRSDGTSAGTFRLSNTASPAPNLGPTIVDNTLYFTSGPEFGTSLWKSDGTIDGTMMVPGVSASIGSLSFLRLSSYRSKLFFNLRLGGVDEIWESDGTEEGTRRAISMPPDVTSPALVGVAGGQLFFSAQTLGLGRELWVTDGTTEGTRFTRDIYAGTDAGIGRHWAVEYKGVLYFQGIDAEHGSSLWKSDGTPEGTSFVYDFGPGPSDVRELHVLNNTLYFPAIDTQGYWDLWKSDGSTIGTQRVLNAFPDLGSIIISPSAFLTSVGDKLFFRARDPSHGPQIWTTDGTPNGTLHVTDISDATGQGQVRDIFAFGESAYFNASDGIYGDVLWKTDGTEVGTRPLGLTRIPTASQMTAANGYFYFVSGGEIWRSDGTDAGTYKIREITPGPSGTPMIFLGGGGGLFFFGALGPGSDTELWRTDGTEAGTYQIANINSSGSSITSGARGIWYDGAFYFGAVDSSSGIRRLWKTDGTPGGTARFDMPTPGLSLASPTGYIVFNGMLYFSAREHTSANPTGGQSRFWRSDGTPQGTVAVRDSGTITSIVEGAGKLFYIPSSGGLVATDGTTEGSTLISPNASSPLVAADGIVYFNQGNEFWRSDGTLAGTRKVASGLLSTVTVAVGQQLFFTRSGVLWRSDGSADGTRVADPAMVYPKYLVALRDMLLFAPSDPADPNVQRELFKMAPPNARLSTISSTFPEQIVQLDASASSDPDPHESLSFSWDLDNDGLFGETGAAALFGDEIGPTPLFHAPAVGGLYPVKLRVANSVGMTDEAQSIVQVDGPPLVSLSPPPNPTIGIGGQIFTTSGSFTDLGPGPYSATVDYGDGAGESPLPLNPDGSFSLSRTYDIAGQYTIRVTVTDDQGQVGSAETTLTVRGGNLLGSSGPDTYIIQYNHAYIRVEEHLSNGTLNQFWVSSGLLGSFRLDGIGGNDHLLIDLTMADPGQELLSIVGGNVELEVINGEQLQLALSNNAQAKLNQQKTRLRKLTLANTSRLTLTPGGSKLLKLTDLLIGPSATLDLTDNDLIVQPLTPADRDALLAHIRSRVKSAFNSGSWDGPGITSSAARDDLSLLTGLAVIRNSDDGVRTIHNQLHGETLNTDSLIVRHTWNGDADASGTVNRDDYARIDRGYFARATTWQFGDFDHDQDVDVLDYLWIDRSFLDANAPTPLA